MSYNDAIPEGSTLVLDESSKNTIAIDDTLVETSTSRSKNISEIQDYLDSFNKEILESEVTQISTNDNSIENVHFTDQNAQYYLIKTEGERMILVAKLSEHNELIMNNNNDKNMNNDTQIVFPNQHIIIEEDIPQEIIFGDEEFQTITHFQADSESKNHVPCVVERNYTNDDTLNDKTEILQDGLDPVDPDVSNVYNFNDRENLTQQKKEIMKSDEENDKTNTVRLVPKKSLTVTKEYVCSSCDYSTDKKYLLSRHSRIHSNKFSFKCGICERGFKTNYELRNHINTHNGIKPFQCRSCPTAFTTSGQLLRHVRYKHTYEKPHKCTMCDYACVEFGKMRSHMKCHSDEQPYQCPHCSYTCRAMVNLKHHLYIHTGEKPYECDICYSTFTQAHSLKTHRLIHNGKKPVLQCDHCPKTFGKKADLRTHVQKLHTSDKPIKCNRCGNALPDRYQYKVHLKTHEGEKCFKCEWCPYASQFKHHLDSHMLIHTNEKPFHCDFCDQSFRRKQLLLRHHNTNHNSAFIPPTPKKKTHQCNTCHRLFRRKGNLSRHISGVHKQEPTENDQNLGVKHRQEYTNPANEDKLEEIKSIPTHDTGRIASLKGVKGDGQQCIMPKTIELDGPDLQIDNYTSTSVSIQQVDKSSSPNQEDLILKTESLWDLKDKCENGIDDCFSFDDELFNMDG